MENELKKLYNTLLLIETKGESTKIMADCIKFTEQLINRAREEAAILAEQYIEKGLVRWREWYKIAEIGHSVQSIVTYANRERDEAIHRLFNQLDNEFDAEYVKKY